MILAVPHRLVMAVQPSRVRLEDPCLNRAIITMCPRKPACGHQEFLDDKGAGENECLSEKSGPGSVAARMVCRKPAMKPAMAVPQGHESLRIDNRGLDLAPVANDAAVGQQSVDIPSCVSGNLVDVESLKGAAECCSFLEDERPGETGLVDFQNKPLEEFVVAPDRKPVLAVMVKAVHGIVGSKDAVTVSHDAGPMSRAGSCGDATRNARHLPDTPAAPVKRVRSCNDTPRSAWYLPVITADR